MREEDGRSGVSSPASWWPEAPAVVRLGRQPLHEEEEEEKREEGKEKKKKRKRKRKRKGERVIVIDDGRGIK